MSSTNVLKFPERQEPETQLKVVPSHQEQLTGQINDNREAIRVIPVDWTEDDPNFTAEELLAEQRNPVTRNEHNFHPSEWTHDDPDLEVEEQKGLLGRGID